MPPPIRLSAIASTRNCSSTSRPFAPIAMRRPISRVRSVTDTSMMFMMPMPPTMSETPAMPASSVVIVPIACGADVGHFLERPDHEVVVLARDDLVAGPQQHGDLVGDCALVSPADAAETVMLLDVGHARAASSCTVV